MTEFILRFLRKDLKKELIKVHGGLDLPIAGEPSQVISNTFQPRKVALIGSDYIGLKPTMHIKEWWACGLTRLEWHIKRFESRICTAGIH